MLDFISQKVGTGIIIVVVVIANLYLMGEHGGRGGDYIEQQDYTEPDRYTGLDDTPKTYEDLQQEYEILKQLFESPTPSPSPN